MIGIKNKHQDKVIAVIGSGETAPLYESDADVCIVLNGALELNKKIEYFCSFDHRVTHKPYFKSKPEVIRLLGCNVASMCEFTYPTGPREVHYTQTFRENPIGREPAPPHVAWTMERPETLNEVTIDSEHMYLAGNIAIPGFQLAYQMGAREIHLYGIGLNKHSYFDGHDDPSNEKGYGQFAPDVLNRLIEQVKQRGIVVKATKERESKLLGVEWLKEEIEKIKIHS